ncbi:hypothetical protein [Thaumasiovibrio subtropicus]|uniref:hypothetical protein n=1 Tax=Thaumasiovibrio subtropicus TaxID=1891207 RepID=UPI000B34FAC9|nr:hypothetical protein [Thaumasiovibrio subtropicus]
MKNVKLTLVGAVAAGLLTGCQYQDQERLLISDLTVEDQQLQACIDYNVQFHPANAGAKYADEIKLIECNDVRTLNGIHRMPNLEFLGFNSGPHLASAEDSARRDAARELFQEKTLGYTFALPDTLHPDHDGEKLEDLAPLATLKNLKSLWFEEQTLTDFSPLAELNSLEHFMNHRSFEFEDLSFVSQHPNLKLLMVIETGVTDITPLQHSDQLEILALWENNIDTDISLSHMDKLVEANFAGAFRNASNMPTLIESVTKLPITDYLEISYTNLTDLPVFETHNLQKLNLDNNNLQNTQMLSELESMSHVWMSGNNINDIYELSKLKGLQDVELARNNLTSIPSNIIDNFVSNSPDIRRINLYCNPIPETDIEALKEALPDANINFPNCVH